MILDILINVLNGQRSTSTRAHAARVPGLYTLGHECLLISRNRAERDSTLLSLDSRARQAPIEFDGELKLVVQKGRSFQRQHPKIAVLVDRGRYLIIGKPEQPIEVESSCFAVTDLPQSGVIFRIDESTADSNPQDWIKECVTSLNADRLTERLDELVALPTRHSTSPEYEAAARLCEGWLRAAGCEVERQAFPLPGGASFNVIGDRHGAAPRPGLVVIGAHLDSVNHEDPAGLAPGADDNASGAVVVTAVADALAGISLEHDVRFVLFAGEEQGLYGSRHFVATLSTEDRGRLRGVLNLDMVASRNTSTPTVLLEGHPISQSLLEQLAAAAATYTTLGVQISIDPFASDHVSFIEAGLPAVLTIEGNDGAYAHEHTSRDTADRLDPALMREIAAMDLAWVASAAGHVTATRDRIEADKRALPAPSNFHALYDAGARAGRGAQSARSLVASEALKNLRVQASSLATSVDEATGRPHQLSVGGANPESLHRAPNHDPNSASVDQAVRSFLTTNKDLWSLDERDLKGIELVGVSRGSLPTARLRQSVDGVEVFGSDLMVALGADNSTRAASGQLFGGAMAFTASRGAVTQPDYPKIIAFAGSDLSDSLWAPESLKEIEAEDRGGYHHFAAQNTNSNVALRRNVRIKPVLFPFGEGQFKAACYLELWLTNGLAFAYVIGYEGDLEILYRKDQTSGSFAYRVYNTGGPDLRPLDGPAPGTPHPTGVPDGWQAPLVEPILVNVASLLPGHPWLPNGATETRGNNCVAYADISAPNGLNTSDIIGRVSAPGRFDYSYDPAKGATAETNVQATIVGMFFHVNWLHDRWYEAGFDEVSGCAQADNYGRGGVGGDPILAEANDFSGFNNANMSTPAEGQSPVMQMFIFNTTNPTRTSNFDALITFHEMGHYISNRLVGNSQGLWNTQGRAMGEGWGDFFAIAMTSQATDDFANGAFAAGGWTDLRPGFNDNYYFSIRRYPYSVDMKKNPLTFRHISDNAALPVGPPRNPIGGSNAEYHNAGEIWCTMLWEVFVALVQRHGHAEGERRMLEYVIGGLKLTPNAPTFTEARDGIIAATAAIDPSDLRLVWSGFAKRGLGRGAESPPRTSMTLTGVVESFTP